MVSEDGYSVSNDTFENEVDRTTAKWDCIAEPRESSPTESNIERRSVLKLVGASVLPFVAVTGTVSSSESNTGYGSGGYGAGGYGDTNEGPTDGGGTDPTTDQPLEKVILFDGVGISNGTRYEFVVTGDVKKSTDSGASIQSSDAIDGSRVTGSVSGWRDAFRFSGELDELVLDGRARVFVNGDPVDPADYGGGQSQELTIVGNGVYSEYECATDGAIELIDGDDMAIVSEGRVEGTIERDVHRFRLTGELVDFTFVEGGTQVYLDNRRINPEAYTGEITYPHAIVFDGTDASSRSTYSFTVSGGVSQAAYRGAAIDSSVEIDDATVQNVVDRGTVDAYWFGGEIVDFKLSGPATVDVEYDIHS